MRPAKQTGGWATLDLGVRAFGSAAALLVVAVAATGCGGSGSQREGGVPGAGGGIPWGSRLTTATRQVPEQVVALDNFQAVGVAVTKNGQLFLSSPRWHPGHAASVIELFPGSSARPEPFPNDAWNAWAVGVPGDLAFVCVQAMHVDSANRFWVLDTGAPGFEGPIPGGAKLMQFDPRSGEVVQSFLFDDEAAPQGSYLNDVRVDVERGFAYLSDSGLGAIVALDLNSGVAARFLSDDPSTKAEPDVRLIIGGEDWVDAEGNTPQVHSDGIALSPAGDFVYYQALTARTLYRVPTASMRAVLRPRELAHVDTRPPAEKIAAVAEEVQDLGRTFATDAMIMDDNGVLYFTALERDAITARLPGGDLALLTADERLAWPDSFAIHNGLLYVTTARIHEVGFGNPEGPKADGPFRLFRVPLLDVDAD